ncbi:tubulin folding cofactor D C terminal-domain-containing protein [Podospora conica]|nr:tubulin folding cofactor D C terminal-domain-containing protein [Schizothecium conicum]
MDAPEEDLDIKLQQLSGDLITDFDNSLPGFLRKQDGTVRSRVRTRELQRFVSSLLDPFQDLPQLLDPHLPRWLPLLGDALLDHHRSRTSRRRRHHLATGGTSDSDLLTPLPTAICRLLYTFCKIRGEKVVVRFLSNETRHLELLLGALEDAERNAGGAWTWEERYVVLLWLSQLMFVPFDLASISSASAGREDDEDGGGDGGGLPAIPDFVWPAAELPGIATRILPMAVKYLASPGKERDAAKALLVRISMRRDMQALGVLDALVNWALEALKREGSTPYHYIGVLAFLSGILAASADTSDMDRYLGVVFRAVHGASGEEAESGGIMSSALARKTVIKVIRAIVVLALRGQGQQSDEAMEMVETTIGFLLESLADNDTPVRFAASKALSIITLRLDAEMASQVVEAVLESLGRNVLWKKDPKDASAPRTRDLSTVNPLEWHGLMLTLSHLLYRRSPPAENLSDIIQALVMGLSFERRGPSGGSTGTNVRDAACFGIWALARRYTTKELLAVSTPKSLLTKYHDPEASVLQVLGTELVVAASLDPAGNIRRGSSAALQELIGRNPDTVDKGISVVQAVDYHSVALRSRALGEVVLNATKLSAQYGEAILGAILDWRGVGDIDAASRRGAAISYGTITAELARGSPEPLKRLLNSVSQVVSRIRSLQLRQVEELHGLLLSFAAVLDALPEVVAMDGDKSCLNEVVRLSLEGLQEIMSDCETKTYRKPELIAEAASRLVISAFPVLQAATLAVKGVNTEDLDLLSGPEFVCKAGAEISSLSAALGSAPESLGKLINTVKTNVNAWLLRPEDEVIPAASEAGLVLLVFCTTTDREQIILEWADLVRHRPSGRAGTAGGFFSALVLSYAIAAHDDDVIRSAILQRWATDPYNETRVLILRSLTGSELLERNIDALLSVVADGLDDYTTNARGDVGSLVRHRAIKATRVLWKARKREAASGGTHLQAASSLFLRILRLAAEKLDRVRSEAQITLAEALIPSSSTSLLTLTFSSKSYFLFLLSLLTTHPHHLDPCLLPSPLDPPAWTASLLTGLITSADTGNEDLVIASRAALSAHCAASPANAADIGAALVRVLSAASSDRVTVPALEVIAFLMHVGLFDVGAVGGGRKLCLAVQRAGYKTGNVRKIEACVRVYGAVAVGGGEEEGGREARKRLGALMFHPWPRVRSVVVDEVWGVVGLAGEGEDEGGKLLLGCDWGRAEKGVVKSAVEGLGLV